MKRDPRYNKFYGRYRYREDGGMKCIQCRGEYSYAAPSMLCFRCWADAEDWAWHEIRTFYTLQAQLLTQYCP